MTSSCDVFAIAFVVRLALGDDVASLKFGQPRMREHLYKCLQQKKMTVFPQCVYVRRTPRLRRTYIEICRNCMVMPEECDDTPLCQNCEDWFHVDICHNEVTNGAVTTVCKNALPRLYTM